MSSIGIWGRRKIPDKKAAKARFEGLQAFALLQGDWHTERTDINPHQSHLTDSGICRSTFGLELSLGPPACTE